MCLEATERSMTKCLTRNQLVCDNWPVLWRPVGDVADVESPAVLQRPAASSQAGQHQSVSLQHHLLPQSTPSQVGSHLWQTDGDRERNICYFRYLKKVCISHAWTIETILSVFIHHKKWKNVLYSCSVFCTNTGLTKALTYQRTWILLNIVLEWNQ